jgi:two-component system alkaline phosphatase synthesis response regulator PhoP
MLSATSHSMSRLGTGAVGAAIRAGTARLTRKESQLLAILQQNAGRCLSRGYLLETIWGYRNGTKTRTLDVHVQRLRRKLGPEQAAHILTVLRSGYSWQEVPAVTRAGIN